MASEIEDQQRYYNMVNSSKMGDLDINLIALYSRTPALFDKRSPFYKDKQYSERAWNDIALKLGYKVEILRDRMLQLRNRYNLEKRKIEAARSESLPNPKSTWGLYKYLLFFDGHIKQRRSYKMLKKIQEAEESDNINHFMATNNSNSTSNDKSFLSNHLPMMPTLMRHNHREDTSTNDFKNENYSDDSEMVEAIPILSGSESAEADLGLIKSPDSSFKNDELLGAAPMTMIHNNPFAGSSSQYGDFHMSNSSFGIDRKLNKYAMFGNFIAAALADMPDSLATAAMQKITLEIFAAKGGN